MGASGNSDRDSRRGSVVEILGIMGRLGCIAFGGPVAHLAHFQRELVERRRWVDAEEYADLIAFCQFLPGPASSQVGMCLGLRRAGLAGMCAAWFAFTMPSVLLLLAAAAGVAHLGHGDRGWLAGLLAAVVAIVADAVCKLGRKCCPDARRLSLAVVAAVAMLLAPQPWVQLLVILGGAAAGLALLPRPTAEAARAAPGMRLGPMTMTVGWGILFALVVAPIVLAAVLAPSQGPLAVYAAFARTGALVFGGGHVVLPMLQAEVVGPGWLDDATFLAGYGVTQAMPGPIFTFSAYLGAAIGAGGGWASMLGFATAALFGVFMPSFGLVAALMPLWQRLRAAPRIRQALHGVNAAVIGLLIAALYQPVWRKAVAVEEPARAVAVILGAWLLLAVWRLPAWAVVALAATAGAAIGL